MPVETVIWDMDGTLFPGRASTWIAKAKDVYVERRHGLGNYGTPDEFIELFMRKGIFDEAALRGWEASNVNVNSYHTLSLCLTDMRFRDGVLERDQLISAKNELLEGLTVEEFFQLHDQVQYTHGVEQAIDDLNAAGVDQILYSNGNGLFVNAEKNHFGMKHGRGMTPLMRFRSGKEGLYNYQDNFPLDAVYTGMLRLEYEKTLPVLRYIERNGIDPRAVVAIDDTGVDMLQLLRGKGVRVYGFYNPDDNTTGTKYRDKMHEADIPIIEGSLSDFGRAVMQ